MVKWMYYLAVAMLLAAAVDDAAAAAAAEPRNTGTVITLTQFSWIAAAEDGKTPEETTYESLVITFEEVTPAISSGVCSIVYKEEGIEINQEGTLAELVCSIDLVTAEKTDLPVGSIEYLLGVTEKNGDHYSGSATFAVVRDDFTVIVGTIGCGDTSYIRTVEANEDDCTALGGAGVDLDGRVLPKNDFACYVQPSSRSSDPTDTDVNGCIDLTTTEIKVCLSDMASIPITEKTATSLTVNSLTSETATGALDITYTDDGTPGDYTTLEVILQGSTDTAANELLQVFKFEVSTETDTSVTIDPYAQGLTTYDVCGVLSTTSDPTHMKDVQTVETSGTITDLNVFMVEDAGAGLVEFGFNNARVKQKDRKYYATLEDSDGQKSATPAKVGINCVGVTQGNTCYGFLSTAQMTGTKTLTVGYGDATPSDFADPANKIIGTLIFTPGP